MKVFISLWIEKMKTKRENRKKEKLRKEEEKKKRDRDKIRLHPYYSSVSEKERRSWTPSFRRTMLLLEMFPEDDITIPLLPNGNIDYASAKHHPKNTREEKIHYCALSNKLIYTHWDRNITFFKLSDEQLDDEVELCDMHWEDIDPDSVQRKPTNYI